MTSTIRAITRGRPGWAFGVYIPGLIHAPTIPAPAPPPAPRPGNAPATDRPAPDAEPATVMRAFRLPRTLDDALHQTATKHGTTRSDMARRYLEASIAAEHAGDSHAGETLIPLSAALRAIAALSPSADHSPDTPRGKPGEPLDKPLTCMQP